MDKISKKANRKQILLGFVLLGILLALAGFIAWTIWKAFITLSPEIATAIVAFSTTVLVSVISLILSKHWERRKEIEQEHRKHKLPIYEDFLAFLFKMYRSQIIDKKPISEEEMVEFIYGFTQKIMVWGSDSVLKVYSEFRRKYVSLAEQPSSSMIEPMLVLEKLLYAIRSDVGHKNKGLAPGDLLSLFISDIERYLKMESTSQNID